MASSSSSPRMRRRALSAVRRKCRLPTPGISTGYWKAMKTPACARSSGCMDKRSFPSKSTSPFVTSYVSRPESTCDSVLLPEPLGPMMACTSPGMSSRSIPLRTSRPATRTCRSLMLSSAFIPRSLPGSR
jgi:hypothetical protein